MDTMVGAGGSLPRFSRYLWLTLGMFVVFAATFVFYVLSEKQVDRANVARLQSYALADELRQSSDDLTRMVRTYVATSQPRYKQHYQEILDIRDGRKPRPVAYANIYWDLVLADDERPRPLGPAVPLLELMRRAGFTAGEFAKLEEAKANSDALTRAEFAAMALIESAELPPGVARARAVQLLFDADYHDAKAAIMRPIGEFHESAEQRTAAAVEYAVAHAARMRVAFVVLGLLVVCLLWGARRNWLSQTQINLARIDAQREQAEEEVRRRTQELNESVRQHQLAAERAEYLAYYDSLTALPNRSMFSKLLNQSISLARREARQLAVLFLDLDGFKNVNDTIGHSAGDRLLQEFAKRLLVCLRESDAVARLGGDEFVILLPVLHSGTDVEIVANKVLAAASKPFAALGQEFRVTVSVGVCIYPEDGDDEESLMKNADIAMYQAKEHGKNSFRLYSPEMNTHSLERFTLESALRQALACDEFRLHYQPRIDAHSDAIAGMEALLRWQHPELGIVAPAQFVPIAEETGLIVSIGKWVLRTACAQNVIWQQKGLPHLTVAVNLSARQFYDDDLLGDVSSILEATGMRPGLLELEITESTLLRDLEKAMRTLKAFADMGVHLAIDNFGTGYSSLSNLRRFPIDTIKIDGSFFRDLSSHAGNRSVAEGIIAMGRSLGRTVIAEGVETRAQVDFLREQACDEFQGFYFSKAVPADEFAKLLEARTTPVAA